MLMLHLWPVGGFESHTSTTFFFYNYFNIKSRPLKDGRWRTYHNVL